MKSLSVLMLPWLAHGHSNRYLELAKRLTQEQSNLSVHFCSTPVILESMRANLHSSPSQARISLVEIHLPEHADLPPHLQTTKHLLPHLVPTLIQAFAQCEQTFSDLLETIKPDFLIFDLYQAWAAKLARQRNIPAAVFIDAAVAYSTYAHDHFEPSKEFPFPAIKITRENRRHKRGPVEDHRGYLEFVEERMTKCWQLSDFVIARSFHELESKYINYLSTLTGKEVVPTGPAIPDISSTVSPEFSLEADKVLHWLNQRDRRSVVFVSFGSECFMPYKEMEQLALGLELSGASFIWVNRFPKKNEKGQEGDSEIETDKELSAKALLHGLVERVGKERGFVVTSWAPQQEILRHDNLGVFLTHCGWSSILEGMQAGTPMLALPMDWDQPINAKFIVELGIAVEIPQCGLGNFKAEDVAAFIKRILGSESGDSVRKNAQKWAEVIRNRKDDDIGILADKIVGLVTNVPQADEM